MCDLAATGADGTPLAVLLVAALLAVAVGVLLVRRAGLGVAVVLVALLVAAGIAAPAPAQAACPPGGAPVGGGPVEPPVDPPVAPAQIALIVTDAIFALPGPRTVGIDVQNVSTVAAFNVTTQDAPPSGVLVDASGCVVLAQGSSCTILVEVSASASPFSWSYAVAGDNTNSVADSITALGPTTLSIDPATSFLAIPGDSAVFTVLNTGALDAPFLAVTLAGAEPDAYTISANTCSGTLAAGANCSFALAYGVPAGSGTAELRVTALNAPTLLVVLPN